MMHRRFLLTASGLALLAPMPARATPDEVAAAMRKLFGEVVPKPGRVKLDVPLLVENGNAVAMTVSVDSTDPVASIHVFAEANPLPNVANFVFGPRAGRPRVSTRIRLISSPSPPAWTEPWHGC
jgi:sulfur-oxidizing protein SoxY